MRSHRSPAASWLAIISAGLLGAALTGEPEALNAPGVTFQTGWDNSKKTGGIVFDTTVTDLAKPGGAPTILNDLVVQNSTISDTSFSGGLCRLELRSRVVDILLSDCAPRDERFEPSDRALGIIEPSGGTAICGVVSHDVEAVEHLAFRDERPLGERALGDDAVDTRSNLDASERRHLADELVRFSDRRGCNGHDTDLRRRWDERLGRSLLLGGE